MSYDQSKENLVLQIDLALKKKEIKDSIEPGIIDEENLKNTLIESEEKLWKSSEKEIYLYETIKKKIEAIESNIYLNRPSPIIPTIQHKKIINIITVIISIIFFTVIYFNFQWISNLKYNMIIFIPSGIFLLILGIIILRKIIYRYMISKNDKKKKLWMGNIRKEKERAGVKELEEDLKNAKNQIEIALQEKGLLPLLREIIAEKLNVSYEMILPRLTINGLSEVFNPEYEISTEASLKLKPMLNSMPGGSIGVSGPRGVGKSTLISAMCSEIKKKENGLIAMVSAPVDYEAREFILHIFSSVCHSFLNHKGKPYNESSYEESPLPHNKKYIEYILPYFKNFRRFLIFFATVTIFLFTLIISAKTNEFFKPSSLKPELNKKVKTLPDTNSSLILNLLDPKYQDNLIASENTNDLTKIILKLMKMYNLKLSFFLNGSLILFLLYKLLLPKIRDYERQKYNSREYHYQKKGGFTYEAEQLLQKIKFQQSYTSGWSGSLKLPVGINTGISESKSFAERQLTLPEIVAQYRAFLTNLCKTHQVIIGIDELDKIHDENCAHKFLNDIKSILNIEKCFYLISVSESAMSNFERRGIAFRDTFDSSFDDILSVNHLNFKESKHLLRRRVIGLPIIFVALCHCCSGGLARDLIRVCRKLFEHTKQNSSNHDIKDLTTILLEEDVELKVKALLIIIQDFPIKITSDFIKILKEIGRMDFTSNELERIINVIFEGITNTDSDNKIIQNFNDLKIEFISYLLYCSTILLFFSKEWTKEEFINAEKSGWINKLANLKQSLDGNALFAISLINDFRSSNQMTTIEFDES